MLFGINGGEFLVLLLVAVLVVGPERLPRYAEQLAGLVRSLRRFVTTAKGRVAEELGPEAAEVDWASLDPRRYDPRRIVREALLDEPVRSTSVRTAASAAGGLGAVSVGSAAGRLDATPSGPAGSGPRATPAGGPAPFDDEAT